MKCKFCPLQIEQYKTRKTLTVIKKKIDVIDPKNPRKSTSHMHFGNPHIKYGICAKNHYTEINRVKVEWTNCKLCSEKKISVETKRNYLLTKARKNKKEVPSFLRNELETFEQKMSQKIEEAVQTEVTKRISNLISHISTVDLPDDVLERTTGILNRSESARSYPKVVKFDIAPGPITNPPSIIDSPTDSEETSTIDHKIGINED